MSCEDGLTNGGGSWEVVPSRTSKVKTVKSSKSETTFTPIKRERKNSDISRTDGDDKRTAITRDHTRTGVTRTEEAGPHTSKIHYPSSTVTNGLVEAASTSTSKDDISDKIGAPFITVESTSLLQTREAKDRTVSNNQFSVLSYKPERSRNEASRKERTQRGILPIESLSGYTQSNGTLEKPVLPDFSLSSASDWPSIGKSEGGEGGDGGGGNAWSSIVRKPPQVLPRKTKPHPQATKGAESGGESDDNDESSSGKKRKRKKKKKSSLQPAEERHRDQPLMLELGSMFEALEVKKSSKTIIASGVGPLILPQSKPTNEQQKLPTRGGNILDSTAPVMRRGKEREQPKKKRPTALRRVIDREKQERKRIREGGDLCATSEGGEGGDLCATNEGGEGGDLCATSEGGEGDVCVTSGEGGEGGDEMTIKVVVKVTEPAVSKPPSVKLTIHNRKFREYCTHLVRDEINSHVEVLLSELVRFQDRQYQRDPIKAKAKRRYVCGLREVAKHLKLRRLKCLVIPPNLDKIQSEGGISNMIGQILTLCREQAVPVIFALSRRRLAYVLKKKYKVGSVGIFSYDGAHLHYKRVMEMVEQATEDYITKTAQLSVSVKQATPSSPVEDHDGCHSNGIHGNQVDATLDGELTIGSGSSSMGDSDVELEPGNGNQETQVNNIMDTVWKIFFSEEPETACLHSNREKLINHHSNRDEPNNHHSNKDKATTNDKILTLSNGTQIERHQAKQLQPEEDMELFKLNVNAQEFVPPSRSSLNHNAAEFTPNSS